MPEGQMFWNSLRGALGPAAAISAMLGATSPAGAITIDGYYLTMGNFSPNTFGGHAAGQYIEFAAAVTPTTVTTTGTASTNSGSNVFPFHVVQGNTWSGSSIPYQASLVANPWTLRFEDGPAFAEQVVSFLPGTVPPKFVESVTVSGTAATPTFAWTAPAGVTVNYYEFLIRDKDSDTGRRVVVFKELASNENSVAITSADFNPSFPFDPTHRYVVTIELRQTRSGTFSTADEDLNAGSVYHFDWFPSNTTGTPVHMPVTNPDGSWTFNSSVALGETIYIDPLVAIGYDFAIGVGNPFFQTVVLPTGIGDNLYDIYGLDALDNLVLLASDWLGGSVFDFGVGGIDFFRVLGIETSAGLDPSNTMGFVTGLTFTGAGQFTGTQTPLTAEVPEPSTLLLFVAGIGVLGLVRRRRSAR
jgi:hypothetical protein